ncbi:chaplin [Streptomyces sp. L2]|uniref:chaplin n=1 Tax=Streptomyces sp. L2 TaxID=2162665 RepID=UPI0010124E7E|nr:chaplin [Streptomyces sp. L2]
MLAGSILTAGGVASAHAGHGWASAWHSPGILSGNVIQVPVDVDANVCGNTISVVGLLNPAFGNFCVNE